MGGPNEEGVVAGVRGAVLGKDVVHSIKEKQQQPPQAADLHLEKRRVAGGVCSRSALCTS